MPVQESTPSAREVFARNLRRVRRLKDMTQERLAAEAGVPRTYVSRVERATVNISIENADALARAVGVPLRDLVDPDKFQGLEDG